MQCAGVDARLNAVSHAVIGAAIEVHRFFGPGLVERTYQASLELELKARGLSVASEVSLPASYKGIPLDSSFRLDLLVDNEVILEIKACQSIEPVHVAQLLTYLKCANKRLGLVINFNVPMLKEGIRRVINPGQQPPTTEAPDA
jgi:GxxExxY protein